MNKPESASVVLPQRLFDVPEVAPEGPVSRLRGAGIEIDAGRVGRILLVATLAALAMLAAVFFVAGAHKNAQINELHQHGVPVVVTVTNCLGLMGGSGSNQAGYTCTGTFEVGDHRFFEAIPGLAKFVSGQKLHAVAAANGSGLFTPANMLAGERASWTVFVLPLVFVAAFAAIAGAWLLSRRRTKKRR